MGRIIELIFTRVYLAMLATGIFWALTFCGGILFGFGPASATIMSLYAEHGSDYKQYGWSEAWSLYKENFRPANQVFYTFFLIEAILVYGMYLMIQLPHLSLFQIFILLVNLIFLLVAPLTFAVYLKLQVHFELSYLNSLKLSFIGAFLDIRAVTNFFLVLSPISFQLYFSLFYWACGISLSMIFFNPSMKQFGLKWFLNYEKNMVSNTFEVLCLYHGGDHHDFRCDGIFGLLA